MTEKQLHIILVGCQKGDRKCQAKLFEAYLPYIGGICKVYLYNRSYTNDVIQDSFLSIFANIGKSFDPSKGPFKAWVRKIAINHCLKRNQKNRKTIIEELDEVNVKNMKMNPDVFYKLSEEELVKVVRSIPESYREVFTLYAIEGYSHKEIADLLSISVEVSRKKLSKARAWLKQKFVTNGNEKKSIGNKRLF